jgi:hypothetical protein
MPPALSGYTEIMNLPYGKDLHNIMLTESVLFNLALWCVFPHKISSESQ